MDENNILMNEGTAVRVLAAKHMLGLMPSIVAGRDASRLFQVSYPSYLKVAHGKTTTPVILERVEVGVEKLLTDISYVLFFEIKRLSVEYAQKDLANGVLVHGYNHYGRPKKEKKVDKKQKKK